MKLADEVLLRDVLTRMRVAITAGGPGSGVYDHKAHALGSVFHVQSGTAFNQKNFVVTNAHDGWHQINDYNVVGKNKEVRGMMGPKMDISGMNVVGQLHEGLPEDGKVGHIFQIAALPPGSSVTDTKRSKTYTKTDDSRFQHSDGKVDYFHFDPNETSLKAKI
jgi:hypothetical protein